MLEAAPLPVQVRGSRLARGLLRLFGWRVVFPGLPGKQGVMLLYPHTSNWDLVVGMLGKWGSGIPLSFWSKAGLFEWPLFGRWLRWVGGIPIHRGAGGCVADMARRFAAAREEDRILWLGIAPEGTRRHVPAWRSGFYHLALEAGVPVGLGYIDYGRRVIGVDVYLALSGDRAADMALIAGHLGGCRGLRPDGQAPVRLDG